jgi:hypothetical protein
MLATDHGPDELAAERQTPRMIELSPLDVSAPRYQYRELPADASGAADFKRIFRCVDVDEIGGRLEALRGLVDDVAQGLIVNPIAIRPNVITSAQSRPYELVSGWLVWSAAIYCRKPTVRATVLDSGDLDSLVLAYRINHHSVKMTRRESRRVAKSVESLLLVERGRANYEEISHLLGCSPSWAFKLLSSEGGCPDTMYGASAAPRRGRPPVTEILMMRVADPVGRESSVRLRACLEGQTGRARLRLERSEEGATWESLSTHDFAVAVQMELERVTDWFDGRYADPSADFS